ncbi:MAG TPA: SGNH/GDSL hydrolase family protein [Ktedonobacterales bacterium]|nr:SGNH/GDSL hydrolase family protein [Ktedonobacterales bacterium]
MTQPGGSAASPGGPGARLPRILTLGALSVVLVLVLAGIDVVILAKNNPSLALNPHYYMALGDSLSFGFQPNFDFSAGFADDIFNDLHKVDVTGVVNYACAGETTDTMINGGCVGRFAHHGSYTGPQLQAAIDFLNAARNQGRVSPITLEIGSNDVLKDWDASTCSASSSAEADLARMDDNLTKVILPQLLAALGTRTKAGNGDLHLLNYYNPFAKECPDSARFVHELNDHLAADAAKFRIAVVDVYGKFGGDTGTASTICDYTWICSQYHDVHPTDLGYRKIADAVESTLGLLQAYPLPPLAALQRLAPARYVAEAAVWRRYLTSSRGHYLAS